MKTRDGLVVALTTLLTAPALLPAANLPVHVELASRLPFAAGDVHYGRKELSPRSHRAFSADGRYVVWNSSAAATVPGVQDRNGAQDVFLEDLATGERRLISHRGGDPAATGLYTSSWPIISADGRYVAFEGVGNNLIEGSTSNATKIFLYDRVTDSRHLVTHAPGQTVAAVGNFSLVAMSGDGRFVLVGAQNSTLMNGLVDPGSTDDLFLWDRNSDSFELVTHQPGAPLTTGGVLIGESAYWDSLISDDGRFIVYGTTSGQLVANDTSTVAKYVQFDRQTGVNSLVSRTPAGDAVAAVYLFDQSADGRFVLFDTQVACGQMVPGCVDSGSSLDVFLFDRQTSGVELISRLPGSPITAGDGNSNDAVLSDDGRYVYFRSNAGNLVAGPADLYFDVFLRDRQTGTTTLASPDPVVPSLDPLAVIGTLFTDAAGSGVSFTARTASLQGDADDFRYAFRYDRALAQLTLLSHAIGDPAEPLHAEVSAIADDGSRQLWSSLDTLGLTGVPDPQLDAADRVVFEASSQEVAALDRAASAGFETGAEGSYGLARMSEDGRFVAFLTKSRVCSPELQVPLADGNARLCLFDRAAGEASLLGHLWNDPTVPVSGITTRPLEFTDDGRWLLLHSASEGLAPTDGNGSCDLFLYDVDQRAYELVSHLSTSATTAGGGACQGLSPDFQATADLYRRTLLDDAGDRVAFSGSVNLLAGTTDTNGDFDAYLKDRSAGTLTLLSHAAGNPAQAANGRSLAEQISGDGRYVLIKSRATDLLSGFVDGNAGEHDLFLVDLTSGTRTLVSRSSVSALRGGAAAVHFQNFLSVDGRFVAFASLAPDHLAGVPETTHDPDVFLFDRGSGEVTLVSHAAGQLLVPANGASYVLGLSSDGRYVMFQSSATNLVAGVPANRIYRWDRLDGSVQLVSHRDAQPTSSVQSSWAQLSADGRRAMFSSPEADVVAGTTIISSFTHQLYLWQPDGGVTLMSRRLETPLAMGNANAPNSEVPQANQAGNRVLFNSNAGNLVAQDSNGHYDYFIAELLDGLFADGFESGTTSAWSSATP